MLFWKEYKDDTECMHYGRSRYVKVVNKDIASVTTKVAPTCLMFLLAGHCILSTVIGATSWGATWQGGGSREGGSRGAGTSGGGGGLGGGGDSHGVGGSHGAGGQIQVS
jgi:hypothetical protein